ncbi:MAG: hypothetical protein HOP02_13575 [Methylococcaceae bacterium]|nr:hypothetical protein [Methylococcaceae bacterium]
MFKKTKIAAATVALLSVAAVQNASAVAIDESGQNAQVLVFPYYNTNNGFQSAYNIRNTTNQTKAVKVRIRESKLSNDVLDFNVYMSPQDHFSFTLAPNTTGQAVISTNDTTCTFPAIPAAGQVLKGTVYTNTTDADTREGYVEVIEMGVVTETTVISGVKHASGTPANCGAVKTAWTTGLFTEGGANSIVGGVNDTTNPPKGIKAPGGGLSGWSFLLDVNKGNANVAMPVAIRNYQTTIGQHYLSSNYHTFLLPSLASGNVLDSTVMNNAGLASITTPFGPTADYVLTPAGKAEVALANGSINVPDSSGINAYPIAHVLAATAITNDYLVTSLTTPDAAGTDWVITFPMRKHGIFSSTQTSNIVSPTTGIASVIINANSTATDIKMGGAFYNREEAQNVITGGDEFSPVSTSPVDILPREVNILSFGLKGGTTASRVLNSSYTKNYGVDYMNGWGTILLDASATNDTASFAKIKGVPVIGFAAIRGNYAAEATSVIGESIPHTFTRNR